MKGPVIQEFNYGPPLSQSLLCEFQLMIGSILAIIRSETVSLFICSKLGSFGDL